MSEKVTNNKLIFIFLAILFITGKMFSQGTPHIIVLPEHEANFNKLITWLEKNDMFKNKTKFIESIRKAFSFAKSGDYIKYKHWVNLFREELAKLSAEEKDKLLMFAKENLSPVKSKEKISRQFPGCKVDCLLTSCKVTCPNGTKPRCKCQWFFAVCECEPYNKK